MIEVIGNVLGGAGVVCFLGAYFMLQREKWKHNSPIYLYVNLIGALLILVSLWIEWNAAAFVLEAAWALISIAGLVKHYRTRKNP